MYDKHTKRYDVEVERIVQSDQSSKLSEFDRVELNPSGFYPADTRISLNPTPSLTKKVSDSSVCSSCGSSYSESEFSRDENIDLFTFTILGFGDRPYSCGSPLITGYAEDGSGALSVPRMCHESRCPECATWWRANALFKWAVRVESYARSTGQRPAVGESSYHPRLIDEGFTLNDLARFREKRNRLLRKADVGAFVNMFHAFRLHDWVKDAIREIRQDFELSSSAFWSFLRSRDGFSMLSDHVGREITSIYQVVKMGLHDHLIMFPPDVLPTGDGSDELIIRKELDKNGNVRTLDTVEDVCRNINYLCSHLSPPNRKFRNRPIYGGGALDKNRFDFDISCDEFSDIQDEVLAFINSERNRKFVYDSEKDELVYASDDDVSDEFPDSDKVEYLSMSDFYSDRSCSISWIMNKWGGGAGVNVENKDYLVTIVQLSWDLQELHVPTTMKFAYNCLLPPPPDSFTVSGISDGFSSDNHTRLRELLMERERFVVHSRYHFERRDDMDSLTLDEFVDVSLRDFDQHIADFIRSCLVADAERRESECLGNACEVVESHVSI